MKVAVDPKRFNLTKDPTGKTVGQAMRSALLSVAKFYREIKENKKSSFTN